jgi:hypothetical protein
MKFEGENANEQSTNSGGETESNTKENQQYQGHEKAQNAVSMTPPIIPGGNVQELPDDENPTCDSERTMEPGDARQLFMIRRSYGRRFEGYKSLWTKM